MFIDISADTNRRSKTDVVFRISGDRTIRLGLDRFLRRFSTKRESSVAIRMGVPGDENFLFL